MQNRNVMKSNILNNFEIIIYKVYCTVILIDNFVHHIHYLFITHPSFIRTIKSSVKLLEST